MDVELLLEEDWICQADIQTIQTCRKICKNNLIKQLLRDKYEEIRGSK